MYEDWHHTIIYESNQKLLALVTNGLHAPRCLGVLTGRVQEEQKTDDATQSLSALVTYPPPSQLHTHGLTTPACLSPAYTVHHQRRPPLMGLQLVITSQPINFLYKIAEHSLSKKDYSSAQEKFTNFVHTTPLTCRLANNYKRQIQPVCTISMPKDSIC